MQQAVTYKALNIPSQVEARIDFLIEYLERRAHLLIQLNEVLGDKKWMEKYWSIAQRVVGERATLRQELRSPNYDGTEEELQEREARSSVECRNSTKWDSVIFDGTD